MKKIPLLIFLCIIVNLHCNAQSGWQWLSPSPQGNYLRSVKFTDINTGYAIGNYGTILKTIDGGINWNLLPIWPTVNLNSIFCVNSNTIYVVGDNGIILKTNNAGQNWIVLNSGTARNLQSIYFTNIDTGYTVGWSSAENAGILKTIDGGNTWFNVACPTIINLISIFFGDDNTGYIVGLAGVILKTIDAGTNWTELNSGSTAHFSSVYFTSIDTGFVTASYPQGIFLSTYDGGEHWTTTNTGVYAGFGSIAFSSKKTSYIVADNNKILKTTNCWTNWTVFNIDTAVWIGGSSSLRSVFFCNDTVGCVAGDNGNMLRTTDGGLNWVRITNFPFKGTGYSVFFNSQNSGFIASDFGFYKTIDGGLSWTQPISIPWVSVIRKVKFLNSNIGFATGFQTFMKTIDGGNTWNPEVEYLTDIPDVCFISPDTGYILTYPLANIESHYAEIRKTTNGGLSWTIVKSLPAVNERFDRIVFPSKNFGFVTGQHGRIYKGFNDGQTWIESWIQPNTTLGNICFSDVNNGYLILYQNSNSIITHTNDGGNTWFPQYTLEGNTLHDIHFVDNNFGYAVGGNGIILHTNDGGTNWVLQNSGTNKMLRSVFFTNENLGYIVGDVTLLKTETAGVGILDFEINRPKDELTISPNPSNGNFRLDFANPGHKQFFIRLFDIAGKQILKTQTTESYYNFTEINLHSGVYIVNVIGDNKNLPGKVIIK